MQECFLMTPKIIFLVLFLGASCHKPEPVPRYDPVVYHPVFRNDLTRLRYARIVIDPSVTVCLLGGPCYNFDKGKPEKTFTEYLVMTETE